MLTSTQDTRARAKRNFARRHPECKIVSHDGRVTFTYALRDGSFPPLRTESGSGGYAGFWIGSFLFMPATRPEDWT